MFRDPNLQTTFALNLALILQLLGVSILVVVDPYIKKENRYRFLMIVVCVAVLLIEPQISNNFGDVLYKNHPKFWYTFASVLGYSIRPLVLVLYIRIMGVERGKNILYGLFAVNALIHMTAFFVPWVFFIDDNLAWHRGPLGYTSFVISFVLDMWLLIGAAVKYSGLRRRESIVPMLISIAVIMAVYLDVELYFLPGVSFLTVAMTESCVFFYIWLHLQFVRSHEEALKAEQRIRIMVSQIQPHFLFNTLTTIQALIDIDPEQASEVVEKFAMYLRQNIDSLNQAKLIPVKSEIEHTRTYSDIEKVRFPSIRIDYEIEDDDFLLPPLTIQPMVENAIRHGVRGKKHGWVSVSTYREDGYHVINIRDNGKGFDVGEMIEETEKGGHIGVKNVRDRIVDMTDGTFVIESEVGEGTSVTIKIPVESAKEHQ